MYETYMTCNIIYMKYTCNIHEIDMKYYLNINDITTSTKQKSIILNKNITEVHSYIQWKFNNINYYKSWRER